MVCSPGGTTIEAVRVLEGNPCCREAMTKCMENQKTQQILMTFAGRQAATSVRLRPAFLLCKAPNLPISTTHDSDHLWVQRQPPH